MMSINCIYITKRWDIFRTRTIYQYDYANGTIQLFINRYGPGAAKLEKAFVIYRNTLKIEDCPRRKKYIIAELEENNSLKWKHLTNQHLYDAVPGPPRCAGPLGRVRALSVGSCWRGEQCPSGTSYTSWGGAEIVWPSWSSRGVAGGTTYWLELWVVRYHNQGKNFHYALRFSTKSSVFIDTRSFDPHCTVLSRWQISPKSR